MTTKPGDHFDGKRETLEILFMLSAAVGASLLKTEVKSRSYRLSFLLFKMGVGPAQGWDEVGLGSTLKSWEGLMAYSRFLKKLANFVRFAAERHAVMMLWWGELELP